MNDRKILVPLDGSPLSAQTVSNLLALKDSITFPLTLLHVLDLNTLSYRGFAETDFRDIEARARAEARQFIADQQARFEAAGMAVETLVTEGSPREVICELADSGGYDLLVIGRQADSALRKLLFGQVANYVVHHTRCPVLLV